MEAAKTNYASEFDEIAAEGVDVSLFSAPSGPVEHGANKNRRMEPETLAGGGGGEGDKTIS
jgi:hypothetical protein